MALPAFTIPPQKDNANSNEQVRGDFFRSGPARNRRWGIRINTSWVDHMASTTTSQYLLSARRWIKVSRIRVVYYFVYHPPFAKKMKVLLTQQNTLYTTRSPHSTSIMTFTVRKNEGPPDSTIFYTGRSPNSTSITTHEGLPIHHSLSAKKMKVLLTRQYSIPHATPLHKARRFARATEIKRTYLSVSAEGPTHSESQSNKKRAISWPSVADCFRRCWPTTQKELHGLIAQRAAE